MGGGSWSSHTYASYATDKGLIDKDVKLNAKGHIDYKTLKSTAKSAHEIFGASFVNQALNPHNVKIRESRDSAEHPLSTALALILDVTGSMNIVAKHIAQQSMPKLMQEMFIRQPITDPQIMVMGVDDLEVGGHFQVSQFESDIRIAEQLLMLWLENNGGGNDYESYSMPWYFLANHTALDCWEKRKKKAYAVSTGDEFPNASLPLDAMQELLGYRPQSKHKHYLETSDILADVRKRYNVFHVIAEEGNFARSNKSEVRERWVDLLGEEYVLPMADHTKLSEIVISAIEISEGKDPDLVYASWEDKKTIEVVTKATKNIKRIVEI